MTEELDIIHDIVAFCSDEVQGFIYSDSWKRDLETTARKFNIKSEKYPALENEVVFVLTGLVPIEKFIDYTKRELGLDQNVATWLADEVRKTIFSKVKIEEFDLDKRSRELGLGGGASSGEDLGDGGGDDSDTTEADVATAITATAEAVEQAIAESPTSAPLETVAPSTGGATGSATIDEDEELSDYESVIMGQVSAMQEALDVVPPSQVAKARQVENKPPEIVGLGSIHAFDATAFTPATVGLSDLLKMDSSKPEAKGEEEKAPPLTTLEPIPPAQQSVPVAQSPVAPASDAVGSPLVGTQRAGVASDVPDEPSPPSQQSSLPPTPPAPPLASSQAPASPTQPTSESATQTPSPVSTERVIHNYVGADPYREAPE